MAIIKKVMMSIFSVICFLQSVYRSLKTNLSVSGHDYIEVENNDMYQTLKCEICGKVSVAFKRHS